MIVYGASGHAKVIIDLIDSIGISSIDYVVDDNPDVTSILGYKVEHKLSGAMTTLDYIIAIGNNRIRQRLAGELEQKPCLPLVHPTAVVSTHSILDVGTVVMASSSVNPSVKIGKHCILNTGSLVEHDVELEDFVHISPGAVVAGNVKIGTGTHVGAGAVIIPGVNIGKWVTVGAGAVIIKDVPDNAVVVGNPGRIIKYNSNKDD
ncbi:acetyltransferase [Christiangramia salexigens]|uniref:Acetyltransferase n=1 Tax=Christiangramia salexigens TaxID=1913577 RepID=A0A1L3J2D3_9FLAO|nr:acetyltransferase [Christiangramia salexigens]APG59292.1 acetyltransferase [Christiangramia salexigens]